MSRRVRYLVRRWPTDRPPADVGTCYDLVRFPMLSILSSVFHLAIFVRKTHPKSSNCPLCFFASHSRGQRPFLPFPLPAPPGNQVHLCFTSTPGFRLDPICLEISRSGQSPLTHQIKDAPTGASALYAPVEPFTIISSLPFSKGDNEAHKVIFIL